MLQQWDLLLVLSRRFALAIRVWVEAELEADARPDSCCRVGGFGQSLFSNPWEGQ